MSKVKIRLQSPMLIGSRRLKDNVLETLDYIPGHVLRAAVARYILLNCPLYRPDQCDEQGRYHYIYIRDRDKCAGCRLYNACKNFSKIKFSFFYPEGYDIIPLTAKGCKYYADHGFQDVLSGTPTVPCKRCMKDIEKSNQPDGQVGRMKSVSGYRMHNTRVGVKKVLLTKTAIDRYTQTALEGSLYSMYAIEPGYCFEGYIDGMEYLPIKEGMTLRIGSNTSSGFGKATVEEIRDEKEERDLLGLLEEFNNRMKKHGADPGKNYIPILLKSDAKLQIEKYNFSEPLINDEYKEKWKSLIFMQENADFEVEAVYTEYELYRGYDTSAKWNAWEKKPQVITLKGTSFLLSTQKPLKDVLDILIQMEGKGVGEDTVNGFGQIEICNQLHVKGEI